MADNRNADDSIQHGIDDNPDGDAAKGAALGGVGGAVVGALAGSAAGPVGTLIGAVVGGLSGAGASGLAVGAVDKIDNDNTVTGLGDTPSHKSGGGDVHASDVGAPIPGASLASGPMSGLMGSTTNTTTTNVQTTGGTSMADLTPGNNVPGVQTGGRTTAGPDTRGVSEKLADAVTGDRTDDKTGGHTTGVLGTGAGAGTGTSGYYGSYEGRSITRDEYDRLPEADRLRVQLIEEQLHVDKTTRQSGEVQVSKHVVEEQVQVPVTLQHEEVIVTRRAVDQPVDASAAGTIFQDETIRVPVHEEVAQVTKTAHVAEEIEIEKRAVSQQQTVTDTVRHEEIDVQGTPEQRVQVQGQNTTGTGGTGTSNI